MCSGTSPCSLLCRALSLNISLCLSRALSPSFFLLCAVSGSAESTRQRSRVVSLWCTSRAFLTTAQRIYTRVISLGDSNYMHLTRHVAWFVHGEGYFIAQYQQVVNDTRVGVTGHGHFRP